MNDIDFYLVREKVNNLLGQQDNASNNPVSVPSGGLLIPTIGVGGHCLPKDGVLLWWRKLQAKEDYTYSLILQSRKINDATPSEVANKVEGILGKLSGKKIALLGVAYRFDSEDTRNSPTLVLGNLLLKKNCKLCLQDPFVKATDQNVTKAGLNKFFTNDIKEALTTTDYVVVCVAHTQYKKLIHEEIRNKPMIKGLFDGCNIYNRNDFDNLSLQYQGIGRGKKTPVRNFINFVSDSFRAVEQGVANEVSELVGFYNKHYVHDEFNTVSFDEVRKLAATVVTRCDIVRTGKIKDIPTYHNFYSGLALCAFKSCEEKADIPV